MEHKGGNENFPPVCGAGCGFYGSPTFDGMCSKCFKDTVKRKQANPSLSTTSSNTALLADANNKVVSGSDDTASQQQDSSSERIENNSAAMASMAVTKPTASVSADSLSDAVDKKLLSAYSAAAVPPPPSGAKLGPSLSASALLLPAVRLSPSTTTTGGETTCSSGEEALTDDGLPRKSKKNVCNSCKKKVGLTGFVCRCGGQFCSMHRYSDKHDCTFNYKEAAQEEIRKNNPVVVSDKVNKI